MLKTDYIRLIHMFFLSKKNLYYIKYYDYVLKEKLTTKTQRTQREILG